MKVPDGEGVANRTGPESCVYIRKGMGEALTGDVRAGLLSRERYCKLQGADVVLKSGRHTGRIVIARYDWALRGQRPRART